MLKNKLSIVLESEVKKWDVFIGQLNFTSKTSFYNGVSYSNITGFEFNCNSKLLLIDSSPYSCCLDYTGDKNSTIFIVNSISLLSHASSTKQTIINSSSVLLPSKDPFIEESKTRRRSASLILNTHNICDPDNDILKKFLWKTSNNLSFGYMLDQLMTNFYSSSSDVLMEKNKLIISDLLSLEIEKAQQSAEYYLESDIHNIIIENFKNTDFNLTILSKKLGVSERYIQKKLAPYGIKFHSYLQRMRAEFLITLINKIKSQSLNPEYLAIQAGFKSIEIANRYFKIYFGLSVKEYIRKNNL